MHMVKIILKSIPMFGVLAGMVYYAIQTNARLFYVITGSMEPLIPTGSVVLSKKLAGDERTVGSVIVFDDVDNNRITAHRVVEVQADGFVTRGDANEYRDRYLVKPQDIIGRVVGVFPLSSPSSVLFQAIFCLLFLQLGVTHRKFLVFLRHGFSCPSATVNAVYRLCVFRRAKKTFYGRQTVTSAG